MNAYRAPRHHSEPDDRVSLPVSVAMYIGLSLLSWGGVWVVWWLSNAIGWE